MKKIYNTVKIKLEEDTKKTEMLYKKVMTKTLEEEVLGVFNKKHVCFIKGINDLDFIQNKVTYMCYVYVNENNNTIEIKK